MRQRRTGPRPAVRPISSSSRTPGPKAAQQDDDHVRQHDDEVSEHQARQGVDQVQPDEPLGEAGARRVRRDEQRHRERRGTRGPGVAGAARRARERPAIRAAAPASVVASATQVEFASARRASPLSAMSSPRVPHSCGSTAEPRQTSATRAGDEHQQREREHGGQERRRAGGAPQSPWASFAKRTASAASSIVATAATSRVAAAVPSPGDQVALRGLLGVLGERGRGARAR